MKHRFPCILISILFATLFITSCHKTCTCIEMNGNEHVYTRQEVEEAAGGNCGDMVYLFSDEAYGAWLRFYTTCSWD